MAALAVAECLPALGNVRIEEVPLLICVGEVSRPGQLQDLNEEFLSDVCQGLKTRFHERSGVIANGRVGGVEAVRRARELLDEDRPLCLVAGVDTFLVGTSLCALDKDNRLLTSANSNGFIPGEAGAAVLLGPAKKDGPAQLVCRGIGFGREKATIQSEEPLRADGMVEAIRAALADAGCTYDEVDYRLTDVNGEQYAFKEAALAMARTMRTLKPRFEIWHPADCIGEVGAAIVPVVLGVAKAAAEKGYAPGAGALCQFSNDDGARAAMVLRYTSEGSA
jgi:3-oxoacyl-[acyl-carrier-protein] synthase-1